MASARDQLAWEVRDDQLDVRRLAQQVQAAWLWSERVAQVARV